MEPKKRNSKKRKKKTVKKNKLFKQTESKLDTNRFEEIYDALIDKSKGPDLVPMTINIAIAFNNILVASEEERKVLVEAFKILDREGYTIKKKTDYSDNPSSLLGSN